VRKMQKKGKIHNMQDKSTNSPSNQAIWMANKTSCFARFFVRTRGWILSLRVLFLRLLLFNPRTMIWVSSHVIDALWSWLTMRICSSFTHMWPACLIVPGWNSGSSRLVPPFWALVLLVLYFNIIVIITNLFMWKT
jgi:hypothetical protein